MSFIAGAFLKKNNNSVIATITQVAQKKLITQESSIIVHEPHCFVVAGKRAGESDAEKVTSVSNQALFAGRLFSRNLYTPHELTRRDIDAIKASRGKFLAQHFWGRYIVATVDQERKTISLFKDPQGLATVFISEQEDAIYFASELPALYDLLPNKPEIDWEYFASFLVGSQHLTTRTPFKGIIELFAGCGVTLSFQGIGKQSVFWNPTELTHDQQADEAYENNLIQTFSHCVKAWTHNVLGIVAELSGGIDSSSVLMMLKDALEPDQKIVACNFYHPAIASSDEREYAKKVAIHCETQLEFLDMNNYLPFDHEVTEQFDKPTSLLLFRYTDFMQLYPDYEIMSGQGGDHLFMAPFPIESITDYFMVNGFKGITKKIKETSAYYRMPLMEVIQKNVKTYLRYKMGKGEPQETIPTTNWMKSSLKTCMQPALFDLPFKEDLKKILPAKQAHISAIYQAVAFIDRGYVQAYTPAINPLLSQPLVELALSVPTYALYGEDIDRAPFRRGMYRLKKHDYIWRKSKGETSGTLMLGFRKNFEKLSQLVLHGRLAQEGLIDTTLLHEHLQKIMHGKNDDLWTVINLISIELWFKSWNQKLNGAAS